MMTQSTETQINNERVIQHSLAKRNAGAMAGVLLSRLLGVARTVIINAYFGANTALDAFNTAFRFPTSLRDLFADGALSAAFTKGLVDIRPLGIEKEKELIAIVTGFFITITTALAIIAVIYADPFLRFMSDPKFQASGGLALASGLFQVLAFYLPLTMLNAIVMAILGIEGLTFRAMNGSLFVSIGMVGATLLVGPFIADPIYALTWGALVGAFLQLIYQIIPVYKIGLLSFPVFNPVTWFRFKPLHDILKMMTPRALGQGASILALMVNTYFALTIGSGAMTFVATTIIIIQVPIGLFGVATGFASLPVMTNAIGKRDYKRFSELLTQSLDSSLWLAAFTTLAFALWIVPLYIVVFQHGKITLLDTLQNALCICAYASGIIFGAGSKILLNTLYALNATKQIVLNSVAYLIVNAGLSALLVPSYGLLGLGLAFGIASGFNYWLNYFLIYNAYQKLNPTQSPYYRGGNFYWVKNMIYSTFSFATSFIGIYITTDGWKFFMEWTSIPLTTINAGIILVVGGLVYLGLFVGLTYLVGPEHLRKLLSAGLNLKIGRG